jgi:hypothetical protein
VEGSFVVFCDPYNTGLLSQISPEQFPATDFEILKAAIKNTNKRTCINVRPVEVDKPW